MLPDAPQRGKVCTGEFAAHHECRLLASTACVDLLELLVFLLVALLIGDKLGLGWYVLTLRSIDLSDQVGERWARLVVGLVEIN